MKKLVLLAFSAMFFLFSSCAESKLIFPFEADFEKHFTALLLHTDNTAVTDGELITVENENVILLENDGFSVWLSKNDAISFQNKSSGIFYDTYGDNIISPGDAKLNLTVESKEETVLAYEKGEFYDVVFGKYRKTAVAFYLGETSVRIIYVLGLSQLENLGEIPNYISPETFAANEIIYANYYTEALPGAEDEFAAKFLKNRYYYRTGDLPEAAKSLSGMSPNSVRSELLSLGYDPTEALLLLFTVDIILENGGITIDISQNRQYKSEKLRTSAYSFIPFSFNLPFVTKTESQSERITYAGSKY